VIGVCYSVLVVYFLVQLGDFRLAQVDIREPHQQESDRRLDNGVSCREFGFPGHRGFGTEKKIKLICLCQQSRV